MWLFDSLTWISIANTACGDHNATTICRLANIHALLHIIARTLSAAARSSFPICFRREDSPLPLLLTCSRRDWLCSFGLAIVCLRVVIRDMLRRRGHSAATISDPCTTPATYAAPFPQHRPQPFFGLINTSLYTACHSKSSHEFVPRVNYETAVEDPALGKMKKPKRRATTEVIKSERQENVLKWQIEYE